MVLDLILPNCIQNSTTFAFPFPNETIDIPELIFSAWKAINWKRDVYMGKLSSKKIRADGSGVKRDTLAPSKAFYHFQIFSALKKSLPEHFCLCSLVNVSGNIFFLKLLIFFYKNILKNKKIPNLLI